MITSSSNAKPLNPEAKPFHAKHFLILPHDFYHRHTWQLPPPPPPVERWHAPELMPYYSGQLYHHHLGLFFNHSPLLGRCYVRYYQQPSLLHAAGGADPRNVVDGGADEAVKRKEMGVKRVLFRSSRKGPRATLGGWRRVSAGPSVWKLKNKSKSSVDGGGATTGHPSPPPLPPPTQSTKSDDACGKTSIMIKNIPNQYRRNMLLDFLDKHCQEHNQEAKLQSDPLHLAYDFVYLPMDFRSGDNLGYAFVNFTSSGAALKMREMLNYFKWGFFKTSDSKVCESKKICEITWARIQGKGNLVKHFKNSTFSCGDVEYLPAVLSPPRNGSTTLSTPHPIANCLATPV